jgi:hypothetical protein
VSPTKSGTISDGTLNRNRSDVFVGSNPQEVLLRDLNADGRLDIITASLSVGGVNAVSVVLQNPDGSFFSPIGLPTGSGSNPIAIAIGDLNGDSNPDIVAANAANNTVSVLFNNGDGSFQSAINYAVGNSPQAVVLGDFDSDGHLDIVTANNLSGTLTLLKGSATGSFSPLNSYSVGARPRALAAADLNNDGTLDLVVGEGSEAIDPQRRVRVLQGNGAGSFSEVASSTQFVNSISIGDLDQDGNLDLLLGMGYNAEVPLIPIRGLNRNSEVREISH